MNRTVSVVIPAFNGSRYIGAALESVMNQTTPVHALVVVDNASADDTCAVVRSSFPSALVLEQPRNRGFGVAANLGIQTALDLGSEYIFLLNQDTIVAENALSRLVQALERNRAYGVVSAFQLTYDGRGIDPKFRNYVPPPFWDDLYFRRAEGVYQATYMPAAAVLARRTALEETGGFDPLFFMYGEDDDWCRRFLAAGWKVGMVPDAEIYHLHGLLHQAHSWKWDLNWEYSRVLLHLKWSPRSLVGAFASGVLFHGSSEQVSGLRRWVLRTLAYAKCLRRVRTIATHRRGVPWTFTVPENHSRDWGTHAITDSVRQKV